MGGEIEVKDKKNREKESLIEKRSKDREVQDKVGYVDMADRGRLRSD